MKKISKSPIASEKGGVTGRVLKTSNASFSPRFKVHRTNLRMRSATSMFAVSP